MKIFLPSLVALLSLFFISRADAQPASTSKAEWMRKGQYGVLVRYIGEETPDWNGRVDSFDVNAFAAQAHDTGAAWVILTLGGDTGYFCAPNAAYCKAIGLAPGVKCSTRDLPMELADALTKQNIRLILQASLRAPKFDTAIMKALGDSDTRQPASQEFTTKWQEIFREFSERYGQRVSGWWMDEAFNTDGWSDPEKSASFKTIADALRAGNHDSIIAFNPGPMSGFKKVSRYQDFTAGERHGFDATPLSHPADDNLQWHTVSFLAKKPGAADGPRQSDEWMIDYIKQASHDGGAVTMEVSVSDGGKIYPPHFKQLQAIRKGIRGQ